MTNVILVTLGILLASGTALMVTFYGGDAFFKSTEEAEASRMVVEGAQIANAVSIYIQRERKMPGNGTDGALALNDLVSRRYLDSVPRGSDLTGWQIDYSQRQIYSVIGPSSSSDSMNICKAARRQLSLPSPEIVYKCDGSDSPGGSLSGREPCCLR